MEAENSSFKVTRACSDTYLTLQAKRAVKELQDELFPPSPRKIYSVNSFYYTQCIYGRNLQEGESAGDRVTSWFLKYKSSKESEIDADGKQQARWPAECQVLEERVSHITHKPCPPEPYYRPTGREIQPKPVGEESGIIIFQYYPISPVDYVCLSFETSSLGGSKYLLQTCPSPEEEGLRFESRFESGNLAKAIKIHSTYYELYIRNDLYTNRHMQWFYFRVTGMKKGLVYRFSFVNITKSENLYTDGMKPLMYSDKDAQMHSIGWRRVGNNIAYFCNDTNEEHSDLPTYYTLTFTFEFPHDDDTVYFAHNYPYTYTELQDYLFSIVANPVKATYTTLRLLCKSLAGNNVYYVTITTPSEECDPTKKKKAIVITARVHPGETPASWIMHGILEYLTSDTAPAKELRDNFIFKLVPMLNPDGVIVGNHRCSLSGKDLNRQYRTVIREYYPTIWYTKLMVRKLVEDSGVAMYCDLHAHSKRNNIFIFGCENRKNPEKKLYEQVFPLMLHKNAPDMFSFQNCKFRVQKCKEGTGRVVMWMMGIVNSFTLEASFAGSNMGNRFETHFNSNDFQMMGKTFCQTLIDFYDEDPRKEKLRLKIMMRLMSEGSNADEPANIEVSDYSSDEDSSSISVAAQEKVGPIPETSSNFVAMSSQPVQQPREKKTLRANRSQTQLNIGPQATKQQNQQSRKPLRVGAECLTQDTQTIRPHCNKDTQVPVALVISEYIEYFPVPINSILPRYLHILDHELNRPVQLQVRKANLAMPLYSDDSSSCWSEPGTKAKKLTKKKKKKKKVNKVPPSRSVHNVNQNEFKVKEMLPDKMLPKTSSKKQNQMLQGIPQKYIGDTNYNSQVIKLIEIQNKLISLKNKLWFGVGDMDPHNPLSWGLKTDRKKENNSKLLSKQVKAKNTNKKLTKCKDDKFNTEPRTSPKKSKELATKLQTIDQPPTRKLGRRSPTFRVLKVNFESKLPIEHAQPAKAKKKKKKPPARKNKMTLLPFD